MYLINRIPTLVLHLHSLIEVLFHIKPVYAHLMVFGYGCFPNIRPFNTHKLDFRSKPCFFMGYNLSHKGYNYLDATGKIFISWNFIFNETAFPYTTLFPSSSSTSSSTSSDQVSPLLSLLIQNPINTPLTSLASPFTSSSHHYNSSSSNSLLTSVFVPSTSSFKPSLFSSLNLPSTSHSHPLPNNAHSMVTRGKAGVFKPNVYIACKEPESVTKALQFEAWKQAMTDVILALLENGTWSLCISPMTWKLLVKMGL